MAADDTGAPEGTEHGHGRAIHGDGPKPATKGPGKLLHGPHATEIIVISSVVMVLLTWMTMRKSGGSTSSAGASADGSTSAAQAAYLGNSGSVAGFDQAAVQGLQNSLTTMATNVQAMFQQQADAQAAAQAGLLGIVNNQAGTTDGRPATSSLPSFTTNGVFDNAAWMRSAETAWAQAGNNTLDLQRVLTSYAAGQNLQPQDMYAVNWAVQRYGMPPQGTAGISAVVPVT